MDEQATTQQGAVATNEAPAAATPVEGATSAPAQQATTEQPTEQAAEQTQQAPERKSLKQLLSEDVELRNEAEREIHRRAQQIAAKLTRKSELKRAVDDPTISLELHQQELSSLEAEDARGTQLDDVRTGATKWVETSLKKGEWREAYGELYGKERAKLDGLFTTDPQGFMDYVDEQVDELRLAKKAEVIGRKLAKEIAEGLTTSRVNEALKGVPVPPNAGGASSGLPSLREIENMSSDEYAKHRDKVLANLDRYRS